MCICLTTVQKMKITRKKAMFVLYYGEEKKQQIAFKGFCSNNFKEYDLLSPILFLLELKFPI